MADTNFGALLAEEMDWAISQKRRLGVEAGDNSFQMRVRIVGPNGELATTPLSWTSMDEKYRAMAALAEVCRITFARAAMVCSDVRTLNTEAFCVRYGVVRPQDDMDGFERGRLRVMEEQIGSLSFEDLPRDLCIEALMVFIKGPKVQLAQVCGYSVVDGVYVFEKPVDLDGRVTIGMLPEWWV
jgi:hypothetical protein